MIKKILKIDPSILGINRRNRNYIMFYNPRGKYPLVDNKLKTKELLSQHGIPTPELFFSIKDYRDMRCLGEAASLESFVVKPANGSQGRGILVVAGKDGEVWKTITGGRVSNVDLKYHISNILSGLYSLGGDTDDAFFEAFVESHDVFSRVSSEGVPDIRIILYKGIPVMSMLRLPTFESGGKANLHQGGVGAGIHLKSGLTFGGVHHDKFISVHPDTACPIEGIEIPFWEDILRIAIRTYPIFGMGYFGIDFAIDKKTGPTIFELNARPGLSVQIANRAGLVPRLERIDGILRKTPELSEDEKINVVMTSGI